MVVVRSTPDMAKRLVESALDILQREGAAALTVRNISQAAGCSTTGVYTHFGSKHGIVEAIYIDGFESFDVALAAAFQSDELRQSGHAYRAWALAHPTQYMVMFGRAVPDYEPSPAARGRSLASFFRLVDALAAIAPGDDVADRAYHFWATVHGYVMLELAGMGPHEPSAADAMFERALDALERLTR